MIIFRSIQTDPSLPNYQEVEEDGRLWIEDGHIHARGCSYVMRVAGNPLKLTFGGEVDPATDPQRFLDELPGRYHGTYLWAEEAPDDTPPPEPNIPGP
jgi:hypothetical protein